MSSVFNNIETIAKREAQKIVDALQANFYKKDLVATGQTVRSIRAEANENGLQIFGGDWIEFAEFGRGKATNNSGNFQDRLLAWAKARGFPEGKVRFLRYYINKFGTRLHRGQDSRFAGKQSGVLTEVLNDQLITELQETMLISILADFKIYIRKSYA